MELISIRRGSAKTQDFINALAKAIVQEQRKELSMDKEALNIVRNYIDEHLDKSDGDISYNIFIVWKCKILENWKYLISSTLFDGMYYELTFNGAKSEWYLDAYKKFENRCIPAEGIDTRFI